VVLIILWCQAPEPASMRADHNPGRLCPFDIGAQL
jgi:hypothetical protein